MRAEAGAFSGFCEAHNPMIRIFFFTLAIVVTAVASGVFGATAVRALWYDPVPESDTPPIEISHIAAHYPERLRIPRLQIDSDVQHVGTTESGNMATPSNFSDVGWYEYGPVPGESGSAVMAGHVNNGLGLSGVFEHLRDLKQGDDIYVTRADGTELHFIVTGMRSYPHTDVPVEVVFNPAGSIRLNLITCEGRWVSEDKTYDERLVVFTVLADT